MISQSRRDLVGGGVVAEFSHGLPGSTRFSGGGGSASNFPLMGPFTFFFFPKGGGAGPPPESATAYNILPKKSINNIFL